MIKVAVYGKLKWSFLLADILEHEYSEVLQNHGGEKLSVNAYVVDNPGNDNEISLEQFGEKYHNGEVSVIIIPKEYYLQYNVLIQKLIKMGVNLNDIYNGMRLSLNMDRSADNIQALIVPYLEDSYLAYLEYHVADHCNLNCKYCTHYAPLVDEPVFTDLEKFKEDLLKLKEFVNDIGVIRILGGEPLLNPKLPEFIEYTRKLFPATIITVATNGMLLDRIDMDLIGAMQKNIAFFHITYYPPLKDKVNEVKKMLVDNNIGFTISPMVESFNKMQRLSKNSNEDYFYDCTEGTCTCMHNGRIAVCYIAFTTKYFNKKFDMNLPEDESIDLYEKDQSLENIKLKLLYPIKRCLYCYEGKNLPWEVVGKNSKLEDWVED